MFKANKNWKRLEGFVKDCRKDKIASSFQLLTTDKEIIIIANSKSVKKRIRMRTISNI